MCTHSMSNQKTQSLAHKGRQQKIIKKEKVHVIVNLYGG